MTAADPRGFSEDEWERARSRLIERYADDGHSIQYARSRIDDWLIADECQAWRDDAEARAADEDYKKRGDL